MMRSFVLDASHQMQGKTYMYIVPAESIKKLHRTGSMTEALQIVPRIQSTLGGTTKQKTSYDMNAAVQPYPIFED